MCVCVLDKSGVVCKHVCELGEVLTAAAPRLEQRFDADLKEDRILQAQHGGSPEKVRLHQKAQMSLSLHPNIPLVSKRTHPENYPPQVTVKGSILKDESDPEKCYQLCRLVR